MECRVLIHKEYIFYTLKNNKRPQSVQAFVAPISLQEKDFYHLFSSFDELEKDIFSSFVAETIQKLEGDDLFRQYDSREKMLAFYYTWFELLKNHRSFIAFMEQQKSFWFKLPSYLPFGNFVFKFLLKQALANVRPYMTSAKKPFKNFMKAIVNEGIGETIADRFWITSQYDELLWGMTILLYYFWMTDNSPKFERTDAAVEKAVNWAFDLMRPNSWDSGFDLAKFLVSEKMVKS